MSKDIGSSCSCFTSTASTSAASCSRHMQETLARQGVGRVRVQLVKHTTSCNVCPSFPLPAALQPRCVPPRWNAGTATGPDAAPQPVDHERCRCRRCRLRRCPAPVLAQAAETCQQAEAAQARAAGPLGRGWSAAQGWWARPRETLSPHRCGSARTQRRWTAAWVTGQPAARWSMCVKSVEHLQLHCCAGC